jgi:5S rRNA maturation endonuclease (ribonuclease M5)
MVNPYFSSMGSCGLYTRKSYLPEVLTVVDKDSSSKNRPLAFKLDNLELARSQLAQLGIEQRTADLFGLGYYSGTGALAGRIIVPLYDVDAHLIAYAGCVLKPEANLEPLFVPPKFDASLELYNLHRAVAAQSEEVILVEDFFDCMKVHQAGFPAVIALMGHEMSVTQEAALVAKFTRVLLFLDGDDAGWRAAQDCIRRLSTQAFVRAAVLPSNSKPIDLSEDEIRAIIRS